MSNPEFTLELSHAAEQDLADILRYTAKTWGKSQQSKYIVILDEALGKIADNPNLGRYKYAYDAYFFKAGRHVIIYVVKRKTVLVIRVLHDRMNPDNYL